MIWLERIDSGQNYKLHTIICSSLGKSTIHILSDMVFDAFIPQDSVTPYSQPPAAAARVCFWLTPFIITNRAALRKERAQSDL
jgi:hypothetical protein